MRELGLIAVEENEGEIFTEISALAQSCQYTDCDHEKSVGCTLQAAVNAGEIDEKQFQSYKKLQREQTYSASKADPKLHFENKRKEKRIHKEYNKIIKQKKLDQNNPSEI